MSAQAHQRVESATERVSVPRFGRRLAADGLPPLAALIAGLALIASRTPGGLGAFFNPATFARRDAVQYLSIASHGYQMSFHCQRGPHTLLAHVHVCGNVTWFAGYPLLMRVVSVTGLSLPAAGLVVAWALWYLALLMVWLLSAPAPGRPHSHWATVTRWLCLLLAAFFPGEVYFAALFPISMAAFGTLACCYWSARSPNRPLAALAGVLAGAAYLVTVSVIPGLLIAAFIAKDHRTRAAMCWAAAGVAGGAVAVLAYAQVAVGHWNAYFITERAEYHVGSHDPAAMLIARYETLLPLPPSVAGRAAAEQALLVAFLLALAIVGVVTRVRAGLEPADVVLGVAALGMWLIPYYGGGHLAVYRSEAMLVVLVPLLRRLPAWVLVLPLAAAVWVAAGMAPAFFTNGLV